MKNRAVVQARRPKSKKDGETVPQLARPKVRSRIGESLISKKLQKSMISSKKQKLRSRAGERAEFGEKRDFATHLERPKWSSRVGEVLFLRKARFVRSDAVLD